MVKVTSKQVRHKFVQSGRSRAYSEVMTAAEVILQFARSFHHVRDQTHLMSLLESRLRPSLPRCQIMLRDPSCGRCCNSIVPACLPLAAISNTSHTMLSPSVASPSGRSASANRPSASHYQQTVAREAHDGKESSSVSRCLIVMWPPALDRAPAFRWQGSRFRCLVILSSRV